MIFTVSFPFVSYISMIGNLSNLQLCSLIKTFSGMTIYNFSKTLPPLGSDNRSFSNVLVFVGRRGCRAGNFRELIEAPGGVELSP